MLEKQMKRANGRSGPLAGLRAALTAAAVLAAAGHGHEQSSRRHLAGVVRHRGDLDSRIVPVHRDGDDPGRTEQVAQANHVTAV